LTNNLYKSRYLLLLLLCCLLWGNLPHRILIIFLFVGRMTVVDVTRVNKTRINAWKTQTPFSWFGIFTKVNHRKSGITLMISFSGYNWDRNKNYDIGSRISNIADVMHRSLQLDEGQVTSWYLQLKTLFYITKERATSQDNNRITACPLNERKSERKFHQRNANERCFKTFSSLFKSFKSVGGSF